MRMIFDFQCTSESCGKVFEDLVDAEVHDLPCPACTENSKRLISAPNIDWRKMGLDPAFPTAYEKWGNAITTHHKTDKGSMHKGKSPNLLMY
jgi:putative FmdB family regulatory protein